MRRVCRLQQVFLLIRARSAHITYSLFTIHYSLFTKFIPQLLWNVQNFSVHNRPADFFHKSLSITVISIHRRLCSGKP